MYYYEKNIATKSKIWAVSKVDANHFNKTFKTENADFFPVFVPWNMIKSENGFGNYCFYHANLEIIENEKAALWLLDNIFSTLKIKYSNNIYIDETSFEEKIKNMTEEELKDFEEEEDDWEYEEDDS